MPRPEDYLLTEAFLQAMRLAEERVVALARAWRRLASGEALWLLCLARHRLSTLPNVVEVSDDDGVVICGDLHGQWAAANYVFEEARKETNVR